MAGDIVRLKRSEGVSVTQPQLIGVTAAPVALLTSAPTNLTSIDPSAICWYNVIDDHVTFYFSVTVQPDGLGPPEFQVALPIASNFTSTDDCIGGGYRSNFSSYGEGLLVEANVANDTMHVKWFHVSTASTKATFQGAYIVK
jgi:hypothetical protein